LKKKNKQYYGESFYLTWRMGEQWGFIWQPTS